MNHKGKLDWEIKDWSKVKYSVTCHWGVKVNQEYPNPVIHEYFFENFVDMEEFVTWYEVDNTAMYKKIIRIMEIALILGIETYEVATKVRVV